MNFASFPQVSCQLSSEPRLICDSPRGKRLKLWGSCMSETPSWHLSLLGKMKMCLPAGCCGSTAMPRVRGWSQQEARLCFRYGVTAWIFKSKLWVMCWGGAGVGLVYSCLFSYTAGLGPIKRPEFVKMGAQPGLQACIPGDGKGKPVCDLKHHQLSKA